MPDKKMSDVVPKDEGNGATDAPAPTPAPTRRVDETVKGGRFVVDGQTVNAHGERIKE